MLAGCRLFQHLSLVSASAKPEPGPEVEPEPEPAPEAVPDKLFKAAECAPCAGILRLCSAAAREPAWALTAVCRLLAEPMVRCRDEQKRDKIQWQGEPATSSGKRRGDRDGAAGHRERDTKRSRHERPRDAEEVGCTSPPHSALVQRAARGAVHRLREGSACALQLHLELRLLKTVAVSASTWLDLSSLSRHCLM